MQTQKDAQIVGWLGRIGAASAEPAIDRLGIAAPDRSIDVYLLYRYVHSVCPPARRLGLRRRNQHLLSCFNSTSG
jgi:hypothetical protein